MVALSKSKAKQSSAAPPKSTPYLEMMQGTQSLRSLVADTNGRSASKPKEQPQKQTKVKIPDRANHPATSLQDALVTGMPNVPEFLYEGIPVMKVVSNGTLKKRIITLSRDHLAVFITHQKVHNSKTSKVVSGMAKTLPIPLFTFRHGLAFTQQSKQQMLQDRYIRYIDVADIDYVMSGVVGSQLLETLAAKSGSAMTKQDGMVTVYHHGFEADPLNLVITNKTHREALVATLRSMQSIYQTVQPWISRVALLLRYIWYDVDLDSSGKINKKEFVRICQRINIGDINISKAFDDYIKKTKGGSKKKGDRELQYVECMELLQEIQSSLMVTEKKGGLSMVWEQAFPKATQISIDQVLKFLRETQNETSATKEDAERLVGSLQQMDLDNKSRNASILLSDTPSYSTSAGLSRPLFEEFLLSKYNYAFDPMLSQTPEKSYWDKPISHYWINTSHNTYLLGDQLQSKSSVEAYVIALWRGCKCLELDCWDGDTKGKTSIPVVFHGHTLTSKITFRSILLVVKNYLQDNPGTLPIILSLENHCSHPFQRTMAFDLKEIFGSKLYIPTIGQAKNAETLPSPNKLRGTIVIKGKRPPEPDEGAADDSKTELTEDDDADSYDEALKEDSGNKSSNKKKDSKSSKIVPELAKLTLFHGAKYKKFEASIAQDPSHMHSIGETKIGKVLSKKSAEQAKLWREYNQQHMTRTYPAGFRVDSSNYNPVLAWAMGCQLVALNFQTNDIPLILNDGRFRQAGGSGYILKPPSVMLQDPTPVLNQKVSIQVLSGHCLPKPKGQKAGEEIDPYIRVEVHDIRTNTEGKEEHYVDDYKTTSIQNNGFCPAWPNAPPKRTGAVTSMKAFQVQRPDVAMILFQLVDDDLGIDDKIANAAIPVNCLRSGYRSIPLSDPHDTTSGPFQYATLFVRIVLS